MQRQNEECNVECETNNKVAEIFGINPKVFEFPKLIARYKQKK